ncbi:MAG: L-glutamate gamma-semialdehyde dehydrogenase [Cytophagales bacterium]|nr:L-glutamate gamma-semialdehyde dehydrogenase [Cytophagales bacterium]
MNSVPNLPLPINEPVRTYAPETVDRLGLKSALKTLKQSTVDLPLIIGGTEVRTETQLTLHPPHEKKHLLGKYHVGDADHVTQAINAALHAKLEWENMPYTERCAIFLKAADLISGPYRYKINAATMLGQSKSVYQAEIDAACEFADFLRFNVHFLEKIYQEQPISSPGIWNRLDYRALEGFILAITPFNFTAIAGNLAAAPALMGNVIVWKPSDTQVYSAHVIMEIFQKAGLPEGVINLITVDGPVTSQVALAHREFAGLHFTGSTQVFQTLWAMVGNNISNYKNFPRLVGETGGKDFVLAHESASIPELCTALVRGAFEYQGQKCSAASRAYIPSNVWPELKTQLVDTVKSIKQGSVEDFSCFMNAVIDERAFDKIVGYIERAKKSPLCEIITGGTYDKSEGYFISPTIILTHDPHYVTMEQEIFGPVLTLFVYPEGHFSETLELVDSTSLYALTGAIIAQDKYAVGEALSKLKHSAGNLYINDKPTGAVVGQQPFGGARKSGTNDKAGSIFNLLRWVSPRTIKEVLVPPTDYRYPFMD